MLDVKSLFRDYASPVKGGASAGGFTLIELLTVMTIVLILMSLGIAAMQGLGKGTALDGAVLNLRSSIAIARQYAVTHRTKVYVRFSQDGTNAHYIVCASDGITAGGDDKGMWLDFAKWEINKLSGTRMYNLSDGSVMDIESGPANSNANQVISGVLSNGEHNIWKQGDRYGFAIRDMVDIPMGFSLGFNTDFPANRSITFNMDGSTDLGPKQYRVTISEMSANTNAASKTVVVQGLTGMINVE